MIDHRNYVHNLSSCETKAWKKIRIQFRTHDLNTGAIPVQCSFVFFTFYGYIANSQSGQLPVGLIAQLVEYCTGIAQVMGSNSVQAWNFFRL